MTDGVVDEHLLAYYGTEFDEAARLTGDSAGRLELLRTMALLKRHLPPGPAELLDVGGGPGVYAAWLAETGYRVHLVDPVPIHVETAAARGGFTAEVGDARALTSPDAAFDAVLLMGPLYHLADRQDRIRALSEGRRVLRPGGVVAVAAITRYAPLLDMAATGRLTNEVLESCRLTRETGAHDRTRGFTTAYFHTAADLEAEITEAGFESCEVFGVEGTMWPMLDALGAEPNDELFRAAYTVAKELERDPKVMETSAHFLAFARRA